MVLEHLFPEDWLERKPLYAFLLGAGYALVGILAAKLLFPRDPALVAVAFISILLLPELRKIFSLEERQERQEKRFSWKHLWRDDRDVTTTYFSLFGGIFVVYALATAFLPAFQASTLFQQQLAYRGGGAAFPAGFSLGLFWSILSNNLYVLVAIFAVGVVAGDGASFLVAWNASVWGTIFGSVARDASGAMGLGALALLGLILLVVLPHVVLEALSYITAAISGSVISKDIESEQLESQAFRKVLRYNIGLFVASLLVLIVGVAVETWVLGNVTLYQEIIAAAAA